jgi:hypothetical protein
MLYTDKWTRMCKSKGGEWEEGAEDESGLLGSVGLWDTGRGMR